MSEKIAEEVAYHFIGIGGIGMSGLAKILLALGEKVSGSDLQESAITEQLSLQGARIMIGHDAKNIEKGAKVIFNSDIPANNPELDFAKKCGCVLLHRSDLLKELVVGKRLFAVTGTHGKTTTTSLLTHVLHEADFAPGYAIGGIMVNHDNHAALGGGINFVVEADESDATFLKYDWQGAIVTNIDTDHLAHYGTFEKIVEAFREFVNKKHDKNLLLYCGDDPSLKKIAPKGLSYGFGAENDCVVSNFKQKGFSISFTLSLQKKRYEQIEIPLTGKHNALNAAAVFALSINLGVAEAIIRKALLSFRGVKRRLEKKGEIQSITIFDDYAHHPTEIKSTLNALRAAVGERRIVAIFQPHRPSRMIKVIDELPRCFEDADLIVVTDLYRAKEPESAGKISTQDIVDKIKNSHRSQCLYIGRENIAKDLFKQLQPHDVVVCLGAGDSTKIGGELLHYCESHTLKKLKVGLLCGGMSTEHEVSVRSAKTFVDHIDRDLYDLVPFYIDLEGRFHEADANLKKHPDSCHEILSHDLLNKLLLCDLFIPVLHGPFGEDGMVAGFLETLRKPYVGCDPRAASLTMDKALTKQIAESHGMRVAPYVTFDFDSWNLEKEAILNNIVQTLPFPLFVKPSHLGSSIGVSRTENEKQLVEAITRAFEYDTHILVEKGLKIREIEFGVFGNFNVNVGHPIEILTGGEFHTYETKYANTGFGFTLKPDLTDSQVATGKALAEKIYRKTQCQGLARVDFFLDDEGTYYFNEINPFPGCTPTSPYPQIWKNEHPISWLIDQLIIAALERFRRQEKVFLFSCQHSARN